MGDQQHYCVFCCRELLLSGNIPEEHKQINKYNNNQVNHFFDLFSRYCFKPVKKCLTNHFNACDNCIVVLNDFTKLYIQLDGLKLKLNWRIHTLKTIVQQADKVPSRQNAFGPLNKQDGGKDDNEETRVFRNRFVNDCSTHLKNSWPKVKLSFCNPSDKICDIIAPINVEQNQTDPAMIYSTHESCKQNELSNDKAVSHLKSSEGYINSLDSIDYQETDFDKAGNTDFSHFVDDDLPNVGDQQFDNSSNIKQMEIEHSIKTEKMTSEITSQEAENDIKLPGKPEELTKSIDKEIPDITHNTSTTPDNRIEEDFSPNNRDSLHTPPVIECSTTTGEDNRFEESNIAIENCESASTLENIDMEIDEQMYPICKIEEPPKPETFDHPPVNNVPMEPHDFGGELVATEVVPIQQKRSLRKRLQCKICKLTFSTTQRLDSHLKSHKDGDIDDNSSDSDQTTNSAKQWSSSEDESDLDCKAKTKRHAQCSKCTKFFGTGNDIKQHMKTVHSCNHLKARSKSTMDDSKIPQTQSTTPNLEATSVTNRNSKRLLETLLRQKSNCQICQLTFSTVDRLEEHTKSHNNNDNVNTSKNENTRQHYISDDQASEDSVSSVDGYKSSYFGGSGSSSENTENSETDMKNKVSIKNVNRNSKSTSISRQLRAKRKKVVSGTIYPCDCCTLVFNTKCSLQYHQRNHNNDSSKTSTSKDVKDKTKRLKCPQCPKRFAQQQLKCIHIWKYHTHHNSRPYIRDFILMDNITISDVMYKENAKYQCQIPNCEEKFLTEEAFKDHLKLHGKFNCKFCTETFEFAPELALHESKSHENPLGQTKRKRFKCPRCPYEWHDQSNYVNHFLLTHFNLLMDVCRCLICKSPMHAGEKSLPKTILGHHLSHHETSNANKPEEIYRCGDCPAYFNFSIQLSRHKIMFHSTGINKHTCTDCGKKFLRPEVLRHHRTHVHKNIIGELQYSCIVEGCERKFETQLQLDSHNVHRHTGKDPILMCSECGKRFGGKAALMKHKQVHDDKFQAKRRKDSELRFVCEQCGKKFKRKEVLQLHYQSHSGPESWNFCCEICSKKCLTEGKLKEHMRVHTQEKPYVCEVCGQKYAHRHNWRLHLKTKHNKV